MTAIESLQAALLKLDTLAPQTKTRVSEGVHLRHKKNGVKVLTLGYKADPTRRSPEWYEAERKKYTSQADWDREQEIIDEAGGGERLYAEILTKYFHKIVVTDRNWRPGSTWARLPGFDHGKTNPTAAAVAHIDHDGTIWFCGEYYVPGLEVWQHAPQLKELPGFATADDVMADPSIKDKTMQQRNGEATSILLLYEEEGIDNLRLFGGNRSDIAFEQRLKLHWARLDEREPTVKIVCPGLTEIPDRPSYGLHPYGCPNLLWELANIRRVQYTATQLMLRNPSEAIVDKNNHLTDACKYVCMTLPEPTDIPLDMRIKEAVKPHVETGDLTNALIRANQIREEMEEESEPIRMAFGRRGGGGRFGRRRR
ncbi:MAG: hypothetical protein ACJ71S_06075 [Acidobacteriaceae bacterium]|jgi:hypothetical protein